MDYPSVKDYKAKECKDIRSVFLDEHEFIPDVKEGENEWFVLDDVLSVLQIDRASEERNINYIRTYNMATPTGVEKIDIIYIYDVVRLIERNKGAKSAELEKWLDHHTANNIDAEYFRRFVNSEKGLLLMRAQYFALNLMYLSDRLPSKAGWDSEEMKSSRDLIDMLIGGDAPMFMQHIRTMWIENNIIWEDKTRNDEFYWQRVFKDVYPKIANVEAVDRKNDGKNIPDAWIKDKDEYVPVEVKLRGFNSSALKQLQRYIDAYGCSKGIAVGEKLTVELPENITFISLKELETSSRELRKETNERITDF